MVGKKDHLKKASLRFRHNWKMPVKREDQMEEVSALLRAWSDGDSKALEYLIPHVYNELHRLARIHMRKERAGHTLQTTALVNEAYIRLVDFRRMRWQDRAHFSAVASNVIRRILVDHARRRNLKRGRDFQRVSLNETGVIDRRMDLVALNDAMNTLERIDPRKVKVIEMRFFGGLSMEEIAAILEVSHITIKRDWDIARRWLFRELARTSSLGPSGAA